MNKNSIHQPKIIPYADKEEWMALRRKTIGASESAALFESVVNESPVEDDLDLDYMENGESVSPYLSPLGLWALKTGKIEMMPGTNNRIRWGTFMEPVIAEGIAEKSGWIIRKPIGYYIHPQIDRMGCSLDYEVDIDGSQEYYPLEIKNVADMERWKWRNATGDYVLPGHIMIQVQHQLSVTGAEKAYVGVLFGGSEEKIFEIPRDNDLIEELETAVTEFLWYIDNDIQPQPNFERDTWVINRLYQHTDPDNVIDWQDNDDMKTKVAKMKELKSLANSYNKEAEILRNEIMTELGDAQSANLGDSVLTASVVSGTQINYYRESYKVLRVAKPKNKHSGRPLGQIDS